MQILFGKKGRSMYCNKHKHMIRCCAIENSICKECGESFTNFMSPPYDDYCEECADKLQVCQFCGVKLEQ